MEDIMIDIKFLRENPEVVKENIKKACELQLGMIGLCDAMFCEVNPIPVKEAMNMLGFGVGGCHLPLIEMSESNKAYVKEEITKYGLLK